MKRRFTGYVLAALAIPVIAFAGWREAPFLYKGATAGQAQVNKSLTFWAPFDDPATPLRVLKGGALTFVRATTATYLHPSTGLVTTAGSGILRIEANGALIEGARTNSILQSRDFDTTWTVEGTPVLTQNAIGIDGVGNSAWTIEDDAAADEHIAQNVTIENDSNTHAQSFFVKKDNDETRFPGFLLWLKNGTAVFIEFSINTKTGASATTSSAGTVTGKVVDFNTDWWRVILTAQNNTSGNTTATVRAHPAKGNTLSGVDPTATGSIVIDGAQLELNSSEPSSVIYTTTVAVTRNADDLSFAVSDNLDETVGTLYLEYDQPQATAQADKLTDGTNALFNSTTDDDLFTDQANTLTYTDSLIIADTVRKVAMNWAGSTLSFVADGGAVETATFDGNLSLGANIDIGSTGGATALFGHIKNLRIWDKALSNTRMIGLTS